MTGRKNKQGKSSGNQQAQKQKEVNMSNNTQNNTPKPSGMTDALEQTREILYGNNNPYTSMTGQADNNRSVQGYVNMQTTGEHVPLINPLQTVQQNTRIQQPNPTYINPVQQNLHNPANEIPQWASNICFQLGNIQTTLNAHSERWQSIESHMEINDGKIQRLQTQLTEIRGIQKDFEQTNSQMPILQNEISNINSYARQTDQTLQQYSDLYDDIVTNNGDFDKRLQKIETQMKALENKQSEACKALQVTNEKVLDLQWRSMRENLLFYGIQEAQNFQAEGENCEEIIKSFVTDVLNFSDPISIDRAHRLGRYRYDKSRPRPIVVKFTFFKQKEKIKETARQTLQETEYWVKDQYPKEMEEKRKQLYGIADEARKNPDNKVTFVRDRLYINGELQIPNPVENIEQPQQISRHTNYRNVKQDRQFQNNRDQNYNRDDTLHSRTFYRRKNTPQQRAWTHTSTANNMTPINQGKQTLAGKKKATSPLEPENSFKKPFILNCESDSENDSEVGISTMETEEQNKEPQNIHLTVETTTADSENDSQPTSDTAQHKTEVAGQPLKHT